MQHSKPLPIDARNEAAALRRKLETLRPWTEQTEAGFDSFFAQSLDLLCIAGLDGYFKLLKPAWTTRLGWSVEELEAKPFLDFVHPDDRTTTVAEVEKLAEGADAVLFKNRYRHKDGTFRWLRWNARPVVGRQRI